MRKAIVTLIIGDRYRALFDGTVHANWKAYAERYQLALVVLDKPIDTSSRAAARSPSWQKCLILEQPQVQTFDQVVWIDTDIIINVGRAPSVFDGVPIDHIGTVDSYAIPDKATHDRRLAKTYAAWRRLGVQFIDNPMPEQYFTKRGLPPHNKVMQAGMFVCSPQHHRELMRKAYAYEEQGAANRNYEMGPLAHEVLEGSPVTWLDPRFNAIVSNEVGDSLLFSLYGLTDNLPTNVRRYPLAVLRRGEPLYTRFVIRRMLRSNFFIHFAGCQNLMPKCQL
jgi:hypothetical protein